MTYDQIEMLAAIVEKGSFKAASESLHKSQPSLSVGIKKMEEEFGISIFDRSDYRPTLTDQGKVFYKWAQESLESFRNLETIAREMGTHEREPRITLAIDPLIEFEEIRPVFETCLGPLNPTELTLRSEILGKGLQLLLEGEVDFSLAPQLKIHDQIESFFFKKVEMIPVAARAIAKNYRSYPQVVVTAPDSQGELSKGPRCYVTDHAMKCKLILSGYGWGRLALHEIEGEKKLVRIQDPVVKPFKLDLYFMRNKNKTMGPQAKLIWKNIRISC